MQTILAYAAILLIPLIPVWFLYRFLEQGKHKATYKGKGLVIGGPAALYVFLVVALIGLYKYIRPTPPPKHEQIPVTVQLWPIPQISKQFFAERDVRLYIKYGDLQVPFASFAPTADYLEQTQTVDQGMQDKEVELLLAPLGKYNPEPRVRYLTQLLRVQVVPANGLVPKITQRTDPDGRQFLATTHLPVLTDVGQIQASAASPGIVIKWDTGVTYLLSLEGQKLSPKAHIDILDANGASVKGAWVGNELGAGNGKPIEVSTDGKMLKAYARLPEGAAGRYTLRVTNPDGRSFSIPATANAPGSGEKKNISQQGPNPVKKSVSSKTEMHEAAATQSTHQGVVTPAKSGPAATDGAKAPATQPAKPRE